MYRYGKGKNPLITTFTLTLDHIHTSCHCLVHLPSCTLPQLGLSSPPMVYSSPIIIEGSHVSAARRPIAPTHSIYPLLMCLSWKHNPLYPSASLSPSLQPFIGLPIMLSHCAVDTHLYLFPHPFHMTKP